MQTVKTWAFNIPRRSNRPIILIKIVPTTMSSGLYQLNLFLKSDRVPFAVKCYGHHEYIESLLNTTSTFRRYYGIPILSITVDSDEYPRELTITF